LGSARGSRAHFGSLAETIFYSATKHTNEAMPYQLRVDPKRNYRQTEQDQKIGSLECCHVANLESFRSSFVGCGKAGSFSLLRGPFSHTLCEAIR
jgi:hypothetical protein